MKCLIHALILLTFGWLSSAWAQSGKSMSLEQLAAYNKPDREQVLYAGAKTEGKITSMSSGISYCATWAVGLSPDCSRGKATEE